MNAFLCGCMLAAFWVEFCGEHWRWASVLLLLSVLNGFVAWGLK